MSMRHPRAGRPRIPALALGLWAVLICLNGAVLSLTYWGLRESRRAQVEHAEATSQTLAQVLEQNIQGRFRQIELLFSAAEDEAGRLPRGMADPHLAQSLPLFQRRMPALARLWFVDATGAIRQGPPADALTRTRMVEALQELQERPRSGLHLSPPWRDGPQAPWRLLVSQGVPGPHGAFAGAVMADLPLAQLTATLDRVDVGPHGTISLRSGNFSLLARTPAIPGQDRLLGNRQLSGEYLEAVKAQAPLAHFTTASVLDGQRRTYALRRIEHPRLYVLVGLAERDYLHAWRHQAAALALAIAVILALSLAIAWMARTTWIHQRAHLARLAEEEARYRLLAENALDVVWTLNAEGRLTYVSPSIERQRGWTPEAFMALDPSLRALGRPHNGHVQEILAAARELAPGTQPPGGTRRTEATVVCKDGREIQVEARWRVVWGPDGTMLGIQGATRDITDRKRMEAEREQLIADLTQALAEVKALSGLLPICSSCKKVRDDQGYWKQIEAYLSEHTEATFTHGLCPDCARAFRDEIQARRTPPPGGGEAR